MRSYDCGKISYGHNTGIPERKEKRNRAEELFDYIIYEFKKIIK